MALLAALSLVLLGATAVATPSARADDAFTAHGSARQVYVVGLPDGASATLLDGSGQAVATHGRGIATTSRNASSGSGRDGVMVSRLRLWLRYRSDGVLAGGAPRASHA